MTHMPLPLPLPAMPAWPIVSKYPLNKRWAPLTVNSMRAPLRRKLRDQPKLARKALKTNRSPKCCIRCLNDTSIYVTLTCMMASPIFVKLKSKVESKNISCKILPISCLAAMSKKLKYSCKFQKEWTEFDSVQPSRLGVNHVYCSFCNTLIQTLDLLL